MINNDLLIRFVDERSTARGRQRGFQLRVLTRADFHRGRLGSLSTRVYRYMKVTGLIGKGSVLLSRIPDTSYRTCVSAYEPGALPDPDRK